MTPPPPGSGCARRGFGPVDDIKFLNFCSNKWHNAPPLSLGIPEALRRRGEAIEVEYEELPGVYTIEEAMAEDAPVIHPEHPGNML